MSLHLRTSQVVTSCSIPILGCGDGKLSRFGTPGCSTDSRTPDDVCTPRGSDLHLKHFVDTQPHTSGIREPPGVCSHKVPSPTVDSGKLRFRVYCHLDPRNQTTEPNISVPVTSVTGPPTPAPNKCILLRLTWRSSTILLDDIPSLHTSCLHGEACVRLAIV